MANCLAIVIADNKDMCKQTGRGDGIEPGIRLQHWHDFTVPDRLQGVWAGAPVPFVAL